MTLSIQYRNQSKNRSIKPKTKRWINRKPRTGYRHLINSTNYPKTVPLSSDTIVGILRGV